MKKNFFLWSLFLFSISVFSQTNISGYAFDEKKNEKPVIVNLVQVNEGFSEIKASHKIIDSCISTNEGFFQFDKKLGNQSKLYYVFIKEKNTKIESKKFLLGNNDSLFFEKSTPPLTQFKTTSLGDKEWRKMLAFQQKLDNKKKFLDEIRTYSKDSLQILAVKLISLKELEKKKLLDKDIALNKSYYTSLLNEFKESDINPVEYLFFELKLAQFQFKKVEENYSISKNLNYFLAFLVLGILFFVYRSKNSKEKLIALSKQELAIKNLILQQKSNKEIATVLFISVSTVKTHITSLYRKLNVVNRSELVMKFKNSTGTST
tara:strand:+ start:220 stop:1176 length:957 start_codon:yes stop_codon:yes gene_type:complete